MTLFPSSIILSILRLFLQLRFSKFFSLSLIWLQLISLDDIPKCCVGSWVVSAFVFILIFSLTTSHVVCNGRWVWAKIRSNPGWIRAVNKCRTSDIFQQNFPYVWHENQCCWLSCPTCFFLVNCLSWNHLLQIKVILSLKLSISWKLLGKIFIQTSILCVFQ